MISPLVYGYTGEHRRRRGITSLLRVLVAGFAICSDGAMTAAKNAPAAERARALDWYKDFAQRGKLQTEYGLL
jgi:hypothetical protein